MDNENTNTFSDSGVYEEIELIQEEITEAGPIGPSNGSFLGKVITYILLGTLFLLPLFILPISGFVPEFSKGLFAFFAILLALFTCLIWWLRSGTIVVPRHPIFIALGGISVWYLLSSAMSGAFIQSFFGNGEVTTSLGIFLLVIGSVLASIFFRSKKSVLSAIMVTLAAGALVFLFQILHIIFPTQLSLGGILATKVQNLIGSWTDLGIFSGLIIVLSLAAIETITSEKVKLRGFLFALLAVSLFFHELALYSGSWIIIAVISSALSYNSYSRAKKIGGNTGRQFFNPAFFVAILSIVLIFGGYIVNGKLFSLLQIPANADIRPSLEGTFDIAKGSISTSAKMAFVGVGPNRFFVQWDQFRPTEVNMTPWWNVDFNDGVGMIPTSLVTVGVIGFTLWAIFLILFFWLGFRALYRVMDGMDHSSRFLSLTSFAAAGFLWVVLCLNVAGSVIITLAFLFTGIFTAMMSLEGVFPVYSYHYLRNPRRGFIVTTTLLVLIGLSLVLSYSVFERYRSVFAYREAILASLSGNFDQSEIQMNRALSLSKSDTYYRSYSILSSYRAQQVLQSKDLTPDDIRQQWSTMFRSSVDNARNATVADPSNYMNWLTLGNAYAALVPLQVKGISDEALKNAEANYKIAETLSPKNPGIPFSTASAYISGGKNSDSEPYLKKALALKSDYTDALTLLSQVSADAGKPENAIPYLEQAMNANPTDATLYFQLGFMKFKNADYKGAIAVLERAITITPNYANAKYFLGLSYSKVGRVPEAIKQFEDVQAMNPDRADLATILSNLRSGYPPLSTAPAPAAKK